MSIRLEEALEVLIDHRGKTPRKLGSDFVSEGVPVASAILVRDGVLDLSEARYVDEETYSRWMPIPVKCGDVLLTSEAPLGRVARVRGNAPLVLGQRLFGLRGKDGVLDNGFLYYALQTDQLKSELGGRATGTTVVGIRQSALRDVRISLPQFSTQRAIANVLGALDDKIAANTRLAATADALASARFAQAVEGAGLSEETFADVAHIGGGATPRSKVPEYWDGGVRWLTPTDVTALPGPYVWDTKRTISEEGLAAISSPLYPRGTIFMTSRATIGAFAIAEEPMAANQGFIALQPRDGVSRYWLFHEMRSRVPEFLDHANGATFLELSRGNFKKLRVRRLSIAAERRFEAEARVLHERASAALRENSVLSATRDTLLPQLMSGKLRVNEAAEIARL